MCPIKETVLFKSLLSLAPDKEPEILLALADAATQAVVRWEQASPNTAITWANTPQGRDYWHTWDEKYNRKVAEGKAARRR